MHTNIYTDSIVRKQITESKLITAHEMPEFLSPQKQFYRRREIYYSESIHTWTGWSRRQRIYVESMD